MIRVEHGDCLEVIPRLVAEGITVDAICCDPPYDLISVSRNGSLRNNDPNTPFGRTKLNGKGFMSMTWDGTGIASRPETWAAVATILRPGGFLLAFGGTRTSHRMVCAIEDAGFVIQDTLMFLFGTGFPKHKSHLKPAHEPICVSYKPGGPRTLQVDESRIYGVPRTTHTEGNRHTQPGRIYGNGKGLPVCEYAGAAGRWPANICHDGSDEVMEAFAAFGDHKAGASLSGNEPSSPFCGNVYGDMARTRPFQSYADNGSPSRFFYSAKADAHDRWGSRHPTVKPIGLLKWLVPLVTPIGGTVLDCFAGSGTTGVAALATGRNAILIEREAEYIGDIRERLAFYEGNGRHSVAARNRNRRETAGTLI